ncbi:MAG: cyclase family protein [Planctomycetes bacterium]|nr:cyclase family protein [Planctomycetota bacterium]
MKARTILDLSHGLDGRTPPFPGDPPIEITVVDSTARAAPPGQRSLNVSRIALSIHLGTHMDAPFHFYGDGLTIDRVPLEQCLGPAVLIDLARPTCDPEIQERHLEGHERRIREAGKVILRTGWDRRWGDPAYFREHPVITCQAARRLIEWGAHLVGVDTPSVDRPPYEAHLELLGHGAVILENLTGLDRIGSEVFQLAALPLRILGRDGSPVRAIAVVDAE